MALELVLKSLLGSAKFVNSSADEKDWVAIAKLIPGATPKQCAKKWDELCLQNLLVKPGRKISKSLKGTSNVDVIVDFLLHKRDSDESQDEVQVIDDDENFDNLNNKVVGHTEEMSEHGIKTENSFEQKKEKDSMMVNKKNKQKLQSLEGPNMVIHVCDESKNLKQDFLCPRDLLVSEMKYFAEYLSLEPQRWEEVDISVHCDVQIFDWLMKYVKRDITNNDEQVPNLEPSNVISILISSDFLRMDSLVTKCIHYCHENLSAILATPCNMNCINDKLVTRITKLFNHSELDAVKDRKDKFKSKLFCKKIQEFVEGSHASSGQENASTLFRCASCKRLLTANNQSKIPCVLNRMNVDSRGEISYCHSRCLLAVVSRLNLRLQFGETRLDLDPTWDINDHLVNLKEKLKSWRDVYWRLWGSSNILFCYKCRCYFPCTDLGHCQFHTSTAEYKNKSENNSVGTYPCCQQKALLYDSIGVFTGCRVKDHLINPPESPTTTDAPHHENGPDQDSNFSDGNLSPVSSDDVVKRQSSTNGVVNDPSIIDDLLAHRDIICLPFQKLTGARMSDLNIFHEDESSQTWKSPRFASQKFSSGTMDKRAVVDHTSALPPIRRSKTTISQRMPSSRRKTAILKNHDYFDTSEDEEDGEEEYHNIKVRHIRQIKKKVASEGSHSSSGFQWDPQRSQRWNQDAQREEDSKRMNEVINTMARLRSAVNQEKKSKTKEFPGGIFQKLDHQFRVSVQPPVIKHQNSNSQISSGSRSKKTGHKNQQ